MVLDIETSLCNHIVQVAYNVYDNSFKLVKKYNNLINENLFITDYYNKYTIEEIHKGVDPVSMLNELNDDLLRCSFVICHNVGFDVPRIKKYFEKYNIKINHFKTFCTMLKTKHLFNKRPKLIELYLYCFNKEPDETRTHLADYDIEITFDCFKYLIESKIIELNIKII